MSASQLVVAKVKRVLLRGGGEDGVRHLSRAFKVMDDDGDGSISRTEFVNGLSELGVSLSEKELQAVWAAFDRNGDGTIKPTEFLTGLRGGLSPYRRSWIKRAWSVFEKDDRGHVSIQQLASMYDAARHPAVIRGERDAGSVLDQFIRSFDNQTNPDGTISKQEFEQHYAGVSGVVASDARFAAQLRGCWNLPGTNDEETTALAFQDDSGTKFEAPQKLQTKEENLAKLALNDTFLATVKKHQSDLQSQQVGYRNLGRRFRQADPKQTGYVDVDTFLDALWKGRLYFENKQALQLLDTNGDGSVDYVLYMCHIKGELAPARQLLIERLWRHFPRDRNDRTQLSHIHSGYNPPSGDALNKFLDAWDKMGASSQYVSYDEFEEWLIPFSAQYKLDSVFEEELLNQWN